MAMEILKHFLFQFLGCFAFVFLVHAQDQSGFISLDCGLPRNSSYTETTTGINYISDADYIDTGKKNSVLPEFSADKQRQMWTVRSFPEGIRNCYNLTVITGNKYLIRASFMYGNYDSKGKAPEFDLHLGPNKWDSVKFANLSTVILKEIIHVVSSNILYVCLVNTDMGMPFISALELRVLRNKMYVTQSNESLTLFTRLNVASTTNLTVRFKDDVYDRAWFAYNPSNWKQLSTLDTIDSGSSNNFTIPSIVMRSAATPSNASAPLGFYLETEDTTLNFYVYMHFAELQKLQANESRAFDISLNGKLWYGPYVPDYLYTTTIFSPSALSGGKYEFSIYKTATSTHPPILNAIEAYSVTKLLQSTTVQKDIDAITNIKSMYGVKRNWQGDPCAPQAYSWEGLNCSYNDNDPPRITSLNLSSSGLNGGIPSFLSDLTSIQYLDLSNNNLTGAVPNFLSQLPLRVLNLEENMLTGSVPVELIERSKNGSLTLRVGGNPNLCSSVSCKKKKSNVVVPVVASVASILVLVTALATFWFLKTKKQRVGKMDAEYDNKIDSLELKNHQFTYSDILKITNNFERILGKGGFGKVYYGQLDGIQVAVKMLSPSSGQGYQQFQAEVKLLMRVHHRNLTSLVGYCNEGVNMGLIYDFMAHGNLEEHLSGSSNILSWEGRLQIAVESAQGLEYLHHGCKPPIIHRDVKSTNILLSEKFQAKLADFGLSRSFPVEGDTHVSTIMAGTPGYLDPEYYISYRLTEKSDVYSFGVVLLEIITGQPVIAKKHDDEMIHISQWVGVMVDKGDIKNIVDPRLQGDFNVNSVWKAVEVAMACVSPNSIKRPTMNEVVIQLNESLATETARTMGSHETESNDLIPMISMNPGSELSPQAR